MTLTPSQTSFDNVSFDNVNAGDILVGGSEGGAIGAVAGFFAATFSSVSFDNVFADDIVLGSSASSDSFSGLSFQNINADQIIIGGVDTKNSPSDSLHDLSFENVHAAQIVLSGIDLPSDWHPGGAESIVSLLSNEHITFDNVSIGDLIIDGIEISLGFLSGEPASSAEDKGAESGGHGRGHDGHEQFHSAQGQGHDEEHRQGGTQEWHGRGHGDYSHAQSSGLGQPQHEPGHFTEMQGFEASEAHHGAFFAPHH
jgi:gas vesicle protein